jgi:proteasome lid subunit RPN8/RPN11
MTTAPPGVRIPADMRDEIVAHARAEVPRECCGVILGRNGELIELRRLTNIFPGNDFYEPDAGELYRLLVEIDDSGTEIAAIYHSHPVCRAYPSPRDVEYAGWPDSVYLICSLERPDSPVIRAFRIVDGEITELAIHSDD